MGKKVVRLRPLAARADNSTLKKLLFLGTMTVLAVLALLTLIPGSDTSCERRRLGGGGDKKNKENEKPPSTSSPKVKPKCTPMVHCYTGDTVAVCSNMLSALEKCRNKKGHVFYQKATT